VNPVMTAARACVQWAAEALPIYRLGHMVAGQFLGIGAIAAELAGQRGGRGRAERVAEHEREDGGCCLVGLRAGEPGCLVEGEAVVVIPGLARPTAALTIFSLPSVSRGICPP
jgi:hypothetical protein